MVDDPHMMQVLNVNMPDTVGYSVAADDLRVYSVIAHAAGDGPYAHTQAYTEPGLTKCCWIYFPLVPGETVREIVSYRDFDSPFGADRNRMGLAVSGPSLSLTMCEC